ncbi:uncharacterized protein LOC128731601 [Anopheles nili]|uniref:uncharacterized protein LOC128731601 n=1 Tax=Anopheles nili TaxID=185578 RepID=UPI00237B05C7|nr:uncharacterized protein LOC128731601 [Anopheles nili]
MLKERDDQEQEICKAPSPSSTEERKLQDSDVDPVGSQRVYKKTSSNQLLTLYLGSRELVARKGIIEPLKGVLYIDSKIINEAKIYGQLTLTFRYGREDEEVMGLKFCNEAVIALQQFWPRPASIEADPLTPLQEALLERLGKNAIPFSLEIGTLAPPSVQLLPAKRYTGAPIGTSYDIRVYTAEASGDERVQRRSTVRLGIRLIHKICLDSTKAPAALETATVNNSFGESTGPKSPLALAPQGSTDGNANSTNTINTSSSSSTSTTIPRALRLRLSPKSLKLSSLHRHSSSVDSTNGGIKSYGDHAIIELTETNKGPQVSVDKPFLWADGRVNLKASLNKAAYVHGENVTVTLDIKNDSRKIVRKIRLVAVQHVDVCMFSNGKFKNIVAEVDVSKHIGPGDTLHASYSLLPVRGTTKNWIAVEGALFSSNSADPSSSAYNSKLATSAPRGMLSVSASSTEEKNVFAIYVSYYVKVKLILSSMGGEVSLKLPFVLGNVELSNPDVTRPPDTLSGLKKLRELRRKSSTTIATNGGVSGSLDFTPCRSPLSKELSLRDMDDPPMDVEDMNPGTGRIRTLNQHNQSITGQVGSISPTNRSTGTSADGEQQATINSRRELFKNSKFNDNLSSTIDIITEDFQTITANISSLIAKSDSSKSNLNEVGLSCNQEISVEAQIHCPQSVGEATQDEATGSRGASPQRSPQRV